MKMSAGRRHRVFVSRVGETEWELKADGRLSGKTEWENKRRDKQHRHGLHQLLWRNHTAYGIVLITMEKSYCVRCYLPLLHTMSRLLLAPLVPSGTGHDQQSFTGKTRYRVYRYRYSGDLQMSYKCTALACTRNICWESTHVLQNEHYIVLISFIQGPYHQHLTSSSIIVSTSLRQQHLSPDP